MQRYKEHLRRYTRMLFWCNSTLQRNSSATFTEFWQSQMVQTSPWNWKSARTSPRWLIILFMISIQGSYGWCPIPRKIFADSTQRQSWRNANCAWDCATHSDIAIKVLRVKRHCLITTVGKANRQPLNCSTRTRRKWAFPTCYRRGFSASRRCASAFNWSHDNQHKRSSRPGSMCPFSTKTGIDEKKNRVRIRIPNVQRAKVGYGIKWMCLSSTINTISTN